MDIPRRLSTESSSGESSPVLSHFNSSTSLILVHDDDEPSTPFDFSDEDEDAPESPEFEIRRPFSPPMAPSVVFLYLLAPYLKLGAMFLPNTQLPLKYGIPSLLVFAVLSAFSRQIWYMLARYMRKADLEDIVLDAFARGRGKEHQRSFLRALVRGGTGSLRVLLSVIYLRESVHIILPLLPGNLPVPPRPVLTVVFALLIFPLVSAQSLGSKRIVYATWASVATYVIWFCCVSFAHANGTLEINPGWLRMGTFWEGITTAAFAFTSSSALPLYASLRAGSPSSGLSKSPASRSFRTLSTLSVAIALCFTLPLIFYTAHLNAPIIEPPPLRLQPAIAALNSLTLLLAIPSVLVTTPSLPISERIRRSTTLPLSKYITFTLVALLSLVPTRIARILSDVLLACALASTFFLPALIHITTHFFKRPLSIVMPQMPSTPNACEPPPSATDELLQRKERALQRRQFRKRVVWDIGVWVLLLPVGGGGFVWGVGRLAGKW